MHKVLIVDDQKSVREYLKLIFSADPEFQVVGCVENGLTAIDIAQTRRPDIIVLDFDMPNMNGVEISKAIESSLPKSKIFILTSIEDEIEISNIDSSIVTEVIQKEHSQKIIKLIKGERVNSIRSISEARKKTNYLSLKNNLFALFLFLGIIYFTISFNRQVSTSQIIEKTNSPPASYTNNLIVAPGKIVPKGEVIKLSISNADNSRIDRILVKEGDRVGKDRVVAVLQGLESLNKNLQKAENNISYHENKLNSIKARFQQNIKLKKLEILAAEAEYNQARTNYLRHKTLLEKGAASELDTDRAKKALDTSHTMLETKKYNLLHLTQNQPREIETAEIELKGAKIAVEQRKTDLNSVYVRSPIVGQVLRINTRIGERVNPQKGIIELGRTDEMYVIAEIYETDISKLKIGQTATIISDWNYARLLRNLDFLDRVNIGAIDLDNVREINKIQKRLQKSFKNKNISIVSKPELVNIEKDAVAKWAEGKVLTFGAIIGFIVGTIIVYQIIYTDINEHLSEYGTLKAMGYGNRFLVLSVLEQSFILATMGFIPGYFASHGVYYLLLKFVELPISMNSSIALQVYLLDLLMCFIASIAAIKKLYTADPADIF